MPPLEPNAVVGAEHRITFMTTPHVVQDAALAIDDADRTPIVIVYVVDRKGRPVEFSKVEASGDFDRFEWSALADQGQVRVRLDVKSADLKLGIVFSYQHHEEVLLTMCQQGQFVLAPGPRPSLGEQRPAGDLRLRFDADPLIAVMSAAIAKSEFGGL